MEIERKFTIKKMPADLAGCPSSQLEQAYLNTDPVLRIRREDQNYYLTYKGSGMMTREEYNLPLTQQAYHHLLPKCDGNVISKRRYRIPFGQYTIELDVFMAPFDGLVIAEVEFPNEEEARAFVPPDWFDTDVTYDGRYHNSNLSQMPR